MLAYMQAEGRGFDSHPLHFEGVAQWWSVSKKQTKQTKLM
jgi:hypothetical protein